MLPSAYNNNMQLVQTKDQESDYNAIDAAMLRDRDGKLWMAFGSFWSGIKLVQLDEHTGLRIPGAPILER